MVEGNNGVVAADDKVTLPNEVVVAPKVEASRETAVELAAPNKGDSGNDCALAKEEETEDNTPKAGEGAEGVDDPNPKRGNDEPPPMLGFVTEEVAGDSDPRVGKGERVVDTGPEEKLNVDVGEEEEVVIAAAAGVEVELKEYEKGLGADDTENKLLLAAIDELGFNEEPKRDDEELKENAVEKEEEPNGLDCEAEVTAEPKEKDGVWLAEAAVVEEDEKIGEGAEKENGEEEDAKELEEREKENPGDWEDDAEEVAEGLKEKDAAIQIRDGDCFRSQLCFVSDNGGRGFSEGHSRAFLARDRA